MTGSKGQGFTLSGIDSLTLRNLSWASQIGANVTGMNRQEINLSGVDLNGSNLSGSKLERFVEFVIDGAFHVFFIFMVETFANSSCR